MFREVPTESRAFVTHRAGLSLDKVAHCQQVIGHEGEDGSEQDGEECLADEQDDDEGESAAQATIATSQIVQHAASDSADRQEIGRGTTEAGDRIVRPEPGKQ